MGTEPLLQALATTNTAVVEGLNTQMHALQEERAALDEERDRVAEGWHSVEALVEAGRKAHHMRLAELGARAEAMDAVMRERGAAVPSSLPAMDKRSRHSSRHSAHEELRGRRHASCSMPPCRSGGGPAALSQHLAKLEGRAASLRESVAALRWRMESLDRRIRKLDE